MPRPALALAAFFAIASACAGDDPVATDPGTIGLAASAPSLALTVGGSAITVITISREGDYTGPVTLSASGLPNGVTATFSPPTVPVTSTSASLTLLAAASATSGMTIFTVSGTRANASGATVQVQLVLLAPAVVRAPR